jgi:hypothetical protein
MTAPLDPDAALTQEVLGARLPPGGNPLADLAPPLPPGSPAPPVVARPPEPQSEQGLDEDEIPEFDPRYREPFEGLLFVGHLTETVSYMGHKFRLVTPSSSERLQMAILTKPYNDTIGFDFAYSCALVAAYLIEIDGQPLPQPITNDVKDTALDHRWEWVINHMKKPVVDYLFNQCFTLDGEVRSILDAMGKASG